MFDLFPSGWKQPKPKWALNAESPQAAKLRNFLQKQPTKKAGAMCNKPGEKANSYIPAEEMCLGEVNDFTEIDLMLEKWDQQLSSDPDDIEVQQILETISVVNDSLLKNIEMIKNAPSGEGDHVSREDVLKLLSNFVNYSKKLEAFIQKTKSRRYS